MQTVQLRRRWGQLWRRLCQLRRRLCQRTDLRWFFIEAAIDVGSIQSVSSDIAVIASPR
ncbi:hypothetical protein [Neorhodopirellula pilleata]|uniref:hypothetical protein n=1 Tax=Neorhodopirellula pilleata TaxID=2714738 RepID=UPI0018CEAA72|nr:hypothetical protein [Neorhodopirellula pilleata]